MTMVIMMTALRDDQGEDRSGNPQHVSFEASDPSSSFMRDAVKAEINRGVIRQKLQKQRHLVVTQAIDPAYLDSIFPELLKLFRPQTVTYNGGVAKVPRWKISCYLEVMPGGIPTTNPNLELLEVFRPVLNACNDLFLHWYRQQHACNNSSGPKDSAASTQSPEHVMGCHRLMTFVTRYTPKPGEQALLKHVDGAGKVDGSVVVALPEDRWSENPEHHGFEGGGLTFYYRNRDDIHYDTRSGDVAFIDRAVWHQADPITRGTRWALVIFYKVDR